MVERINMSKGVNLGWGTTMDMQLVGRAWGMDIYTDQSESSYQTIWVYDRNRTQPARRSDWYNATEGVQHRIVARVELSLERGAWAVDLLQVDSRYKGKNLAIRLYRFLLRRLDITLRAGDSQSAGGRAVWNRLARTSGVVVWARRTDRSKVIDFPQPGAGELTSNQFDLYDSDASIYAVAA